MSDMLTISQTTPAYDAIEKLADKAGSGALHKASVEMAVAGTLLSGFEQYLTISNQIKYQKDAFDRELDYRKKDFRHRIKAFYQNAESSRKALAKNYNAVLQSIDQSRVSSRKEMFGIFQEMREQQARTLTSAADRGVYGNTISLLMDNIMANELRNIENIAQEQKWSEQAKMRQADSLYADAETQRLASLPRPLAPAEVPQLPAQVNPVMVGMQAASAGIAAYAKIPVPPEVTAPQGSGDETVTVTETETGKGK